nr:MAG: hypothetical protein 1 [Leviviridae sp.]
MVAYNRSRSRQDLNTVQTLSYGSSTSIKRVSPYIGGSNYVDIVPGSPKLQWSLNIATLPQTIEILGVSIPLAGVATVSQSYLGSTYYRYDHNALASRVLSYSSQITLVAEPLLRAQYEASFTSNITTRVLDSSISMNDVVTPRFHEASRSGSTFFSPMTYEGSAVSAGNGFVYTTPITVSISTPVFSGSGSPLPNATLVMSLSISANACSRLAFGLTDSVITTFKSAVFGSNSYIDGQPAINEAFAKMHEAEFDLPLLLLEANKTISHLALTMKRVASLVKSLKRGTFVAKGKKLVKKATSDLPTTSKEFSKLWLEARYAWRPLLIDAESAIRYFFKGSSMSPRRTFRGMRKELVTDSVNFSVTSSGYSYNFVGDLITDKTVRAGVLTEIDIGLERLRDIGAFNHIGTAWELIPYSFVVDWFIDVKGILSSLNVNPGVKQLGSWATYTTEKQFSGVVNITHTSSGQMKSVNFSQKAVYKKRDVAVSTNFINLDINLDIYKLTDALALLRMLRR